MACDRINFGQFRRWSGLELGWFFEQWLYESGELVLEGTWGYDSERGVLSIELEQVGQVMEMPVEVVVDPNTWLLYRGVEKLIRR